MFSVVKSHTHNPIWCCNHSKAPNERIRYRKNVQLLPRTQQGHLMLFFLWFLSHIFWRNIKNNCTVIKCLVSIPNQTQIDLNDPFWHTYEGSVWPWYLSVKHAWAITLVSTHTRKNLTLVCIKVHIELVFIRGPTA